ncbi:hypothetical protein SLS53_004639 [Cytospora paraplurivora]|uniref:Uncharacterized protein n=1 Tax=Cytospora paraplurivora TaxID=2898453 RepID=A0AAN9UEN2_9PEZI
MLQVTSHRPQSRIHPLQRRAPKDAIFVAGILEKRLEVGDSEGECGRRVQRDDLLQVGEHVFGLCGPDLCYLLILQDTGEPPGTIVVDLAEESADQLTGGLFARNSLPFVGVLIKVQDCIESHAFIDGNGYCGVEGLLEGTLSVVLRGVLRTFVQM